MIFCLVVTKELLGSLDNADQRGPAILQSSGHSLRDTSVHYPPPLERYHMSPNVHTSPSERSRLLHNLVHSPPSRGLEERPGTRERVDDLEASIDVIDGLVTSLGDFAMRSQVC
jgi:hypothetical protein